MLVHLLYASRVSTPVADEFTEAILQQSRLNNPRLGITGLLCQGGDVYLQVLEGGRGPVNALYNTILRDSRHQQVMLLHYREISERRFTGWTMGHVKLDKMNPSLLLKYSEKAVLDPFSVSGEASMALLDELIATAQIIGRAG
jgi:hypothetical protein